MQLDPNDLKKTINNAAHSFQEKTGIKGKTASARQEKETPSPDEPAVSGQGDSAGKSDSPQKLTRKQKKSRRSRKSGKGAKSDRTARSGQPHQSDHPDGQKTDYGRPHQDDRTAESGQNAKTGQPDQNNHPDGQKTEQAQQRQDYRKTEPGQKEESDRSHQNEHRDGQSKQSGAHKAGITGKTKKGLFLKKERSPEIQVPDTEDAPSRKNQDRKELWAGPAQKISETVRKIGRNTSRRKASEDAKALQETDIPVTGYTPEQPEISGSEKAKTQDSSKSSEKAKTQDSPKSSEKAKTQDSSKSSEKAKAQDSPKSSEKEKAQDQTKESEKEKARGRSKKSRRARKKDRLKRSGSAKTQDHSKESEPVKIRGRSIASEPGKDSGKTPDHTKISGTGMAPEAETSRPETPPEPADHSIQGPAASAERDAEESPASEKGTAPKRGFDPEKDIAPIRAFDPEKDTAPIRAFASEKETAPKGQTLSGGETPSDGRDLKSGSVKPETGAALSGEELKASEETSDGGLQKTDGTLSEVPAKSTGFLRNVWLLLVTWWKAFFGSLVKKVGYTLAAAGVIAFVAALLCCILYLSTMGSRSGQTVDSGGRDREEMIPEEGAEADYDGIAPADEAGPTGWSQVLPDQTGGTDGDQALAKAFEGLFSRTREAAVVLRQQAEDTIREEYMEILESGRGAEYTPESEAQKKLWEKVRSERKEELKEKPLLILVNKWHTLPEDYVVEPVDLENGQQISSICYDQMVEMLQDCRSAGGTPIVCSGYRPHVTQVYLFDQQINRWLYMGYGQEEAEAMAATAVAVPGTSEHELGLAADIYSSENMDLDESQVNTFTQQWLMKHSWEYGFILRYPNGKSSITGIIFEPWHYRYVGRKYAEKIYKADVCLEEYLDEADHPYSPLDPFAETAEETGDGTEDESTNGTTDGIENGSANETTDGFQDGSMNESTDQSGNEFMNQPTDGAGNGSLNETMDGAGNEFMNQPADGSGDGFQNGTTGGSDNEFMNQPADGSGDGFTNGTTDGFQNESINGTFGGTYNGY